MAAGISAVGWLAIGGVAAISAVQQDASRKALHAQQAAQRDQIAADASAKASAETGAAVEANAMRVAQKRAQQANVLALGDGTSGGLLGQGKSVLSMGAGPAQAGAAASTTSVLGGGAPVTSSASTGRMPAPAKQIQGIA